MKEYRVCVQSFISNNSDYKEYDIYFTKATDLENAKKYAQKCINNWNRESKGIIYNVYNVSEEG